MLDKRGIVQIQETIIVLFLFTILIGMFLVGFFTYTDSVIKQQTEQYKAEQFETLFFTAVTPEITCSETLLCIDGMKVLFFEPNSYAMTLRQVYPRITNEIVCTAQTYPNCNTYQLGNQKRNGRRLQTPILLFEPLTDTYFAYTMEVVQ